MSGALVLDGTPRTVVTICRSLQRRGIAAYAAGIDRRGLSLHSRAANADLALPSGEAFVPAVLTTLERYDIDTIVPCSDKALALLTSYYGALTTRARLVCPPPDVALRVLRKERTLEAARECGVKIPRTYELGELGNGAVRFPVVAKPRDAGARPATSVAYLAGHAELQAFLAHARADRFLFQEYVTGDGVGVSTIVSGGDAILLFQHRRVHQYPADGGVGVLVESEALDPELAHAARSLLAQLAWEGPAMVEFRHDRRTREYALMEVNGRFWGSLPLAVHAGVDFSFMQWQVSHGLKPSPPSSYRTGLRVRWTAGEIRRSADLIADRSLRRALGYSPVAPLMQFVRAFSPQTRSALFSLRDPIPECIDVASTVLRVAASKLWRFTAARLPKRFAEPLEQLRLLDAADRKTYLTRWLASALKPGGNASIGRTRRVTLVCRANRIRSPLAAALLESEVRRAGAGGFTIRSAGTRAVSESDFDQRARDAAAALGLVLTGCPQALDDDLIDSSELIVVMDRVVEAELLTRFPRAAAKTCVLNVPDPDRATYPEFERFVSRLAGDVRRIAARLA